MLDLNSRLKLLEEELEQVTPEQLYRELVGFEAKGPLATDFILPKITSNNQILSASMVLSEVDNLSDKELQEKFEKAKYGAVGKAINDSLKAIKD
jgi:hypothetical protein